jgi:two-component system chemotaxis response regulator CheY
VAHVLVIDGSADVRQLIRSALEGEGHSVADAADTAEGLRALEARPADLLLCDLSTLCDDGPDAARALRAGSPGLQVVVMNAGSYFGASLKPLAAALGATAALDKPFHVADLLLTVAAALAVRPAGP